MQVLFDFMGGAHGTGFDREGMLKNLVGNIEGPVTLLEDLDAAADWQEGGRNGGSLAMVNNGFGGGGLGLLC